MPSPETHQMPGFVAAVLIHSRRRIAMLASAAVALLVACGWWVAVVELVPASARPYIGGSQIDSALELILGYNGLGRLTGKRATVAAAHRGPEAVRLGVGP